MIKYLIVLGSIILLIITAFTILVLKKESFPNDYDFAIIDTTGQVNKSYLYYFDNMGNKLYEKPIAMGYMGDTFSLPLVYNNKVYVTPWGTDKERELSVILEIDIENGTQKTFDTTLHSINSFSVTDKYFFAVNTINAVTKLARTSKESKDTVIKEFPNYVIGKIAVFDKVLYAFGYSALTTKSELIEIDIESLDILGRYALDDFGDCPADGVLLVKDKLYFTLPYRNGNVHNSLFTFDINSKEITRIKLPEVSPCQLVSYEDNILISHVDIVLNQGHSLSMLDPKTGEILNHKLHNTPRQIYVKDNYLYSLDFTERNICKYELEDGNNVNFVDQFFIDKRKDVEFYFLSGFYCK